MKLVKKPEGNKEENKEENRDYSIDYKLKSLEQTVANLEKNLEETTRFAKRTRSTVDAHINKQIAEIRVFVVDKKCPEGEWQDYSGTFSIDDSEQKTMVISKAKKHFDMYFMDGVYHRNKKLGLFLSNPRSGKHLIEEMETGD